MHPSHTKTSFLTLPDPRKSSQNRDQNVFKNSFILDTLLEPQKMRFLMVKGRQDGRPKFPFFSKIVNILQQNRLQIATLAIVGPGCLLEASKSLPRASQEPAKRLPGGVQALRRHPRAPKKLPCSSQEISGNSAYLRVPKSWGRRCSPRGRLRLL